MKSLGCSYNKRVTAYNDLYIAFAYKYTKNKPVMCARQGNSHSGDDHERWDLDYYYLIKKEDIK